MFHIYFIKHYKVTFKCYAGVSKYATYKFEISSAGNERLTNGLIKPNSVHL